MVSFGELWESMESQNSPLMDTGEDSRSLSVVRAGRDMRKDNQSPFWEDFISLCSNTDGMAQLFDISPEKVLSIPSKIREALQKLENEDAEAPGVDHDAQIMPTGDNGAFMSSNTDPQMGDM